MLRLRQTIAYATSVALCCLRAPTECGRIAIEHMKRIFLVCFFASVSGCHGVGSADEVGSQKQDRRIRLSRFYCPQAQGVGPIKVVRIEELIANGRAYEGRNVSVTGYYNQGFEHSALYASPGKDQFARTFADGIWIDGISAPSDGNGQHLRVTGSFSEASKGHLSQWPGSICATNVVLLEQEEP